MAKKVVASMQKKEAKNYAKVVKMVRSPKSGAYVFKEEIVTNDKIKDFFTKKD
jgi:hypothetical protein